MKTILIAAVLLLSAWPAGSQKDQTPGMVVPNVLKVTKTYHHESAQCPNGYLWLPLEIKQKDSHSCPEYETVLVCVSPQFLAKLKEVDSEIQNQPEN